MTQSSIHVIPGLHLTCFPWWQDAVGMEEDILDDDLLQEARRERLEFQHLLPHDGLLHCIDKCTKDWPPACLDIARQTDN